MLDSEVITLLSNDVPTIKADLAEPLQQLEVIIEVIWLQQSEVNHVIKPFIPPCSKSKTAPNQFM